MKKKDKKKRRISVSGVILVVILLAGLSLLLYPTVSNWWNSFHQSRAIASYNDQVANLSQEDYDAILKAARAYNKELLSRQNRYFPTEEEHAQYESQLNVAGDGMMGYVEIPSVDCRLAIYHGVDEAVLQVAAGHIEGSSLPVGGKGTHAIISAHRGLPSARLFTDLDKLKEGDIFMVHVLNETFTYEVDQIRIVLPEEMNDLEITEGKDYCTLQTCTPYGINTHRMLVRGHRIKNLSQALAEADATQLEPMHVALVIGIAVVLVLVVSVFARSRKKK